MALTLNNIFGSETGGAEETSAVGGTPDFNETTIVKYGPRSTKLANGQDFTIPWVSSGVTDAGSAYVFGFYFYFASLTNTNQFRASVLDDAGATVLEVVLDAQEKFVLKDAAGSQLDISPLKSTGQWYFIEVYAQINNGSADWEWFIDDVSEGSGSAADLTDGNAFGSASSGINFDDLAPVNSYVDNCYILSGATAATDRYGDFAVKTYQNTAEDATDQGEALADGTWALVGETPGNEGAANDASYVDTGNLAGSTICDEGTRSGPSGDGDVGDIKAAKWIGNFKRSSGGGRTHEFWVGNDADWITTPTTKTVVALTLDTVYAITEKLLEASDLSVPTTSDFFQHGFSKSATGGQDIICGDIWAMLGYVPGGGATTMVAAQGSYTLTGKAATTTKDTPVVAAQGSYALTGKDAITSRTKSIPADQGAYALTGQAANTLWGHAFAAAQGSYALTGQAAITVKDTPITAAQGSYSLSGQAAILLWNHLVAATQGSYTLTGKDAATRQGSTLTAVQGAYTLTGKAADLLWDHLIAAVQGSYALTGQAVVLSRQITIMAAQGSYALNGQAAVLSRQITIMVVQGSYTLTGQDALTFEERLLAAQMLPLLGVG